MLITDLSIHHLRNLTALSLQPSAHINLFYGHNGSGKTSLLEAIYYLSRARSFRQTSFKGMIAWGQKAMLVRSQLANGDSIAIEKQLSGQAKIKINQLVCGSTVELAERLPVQLIHPDSHALIQDQSLLRRQFLDWGVFHGHPSFLSHWRQFQSWLKHRNAALRRADTRKLIFIWDEEWLKQCMVIDRYRQVYVEQLNTAFQSIIDQWLPWEVALVYDRGWPCDQSLEQALSQSFVLDQERGYTRFGPQRADLKFLVDNNRLAKDCLSRGQQKLLVLGLKLAQGLVLYEQTHRHCIYLIDDLTSELDEIRQNLLATLLRRIQAQVFITTVDHDFSNQFIQDNHDALFHVEHGQINMEKGRLENSPCFFTSVPRRIFDYLIAEDYPDWPLPIGCRVKVLFRKKEKIGIVVSCQNHTSLDEKKLKTVLAILDKTSLISPSLLRLCLFASQYYHYPLGDVFSHAIPKYIREEKFSLVPEQVTTMTPVFRSSPLLTQEQTQALSEFYQYLDQFRVILLYGITGSGKTEVYCQMMQQVLTMGKACLLLVPEIGLTPQTIARLQERFSVPILVLHSGLTDKERAKAWLFAQAMSIGIIVGTRSAIFVPTLTLGLIILDEEHDVSFKQQSGMRYSARDLAIIRAKDLAIPIVLGSATPSLESLFRAWTRSDYPLLTLTQRAGQAQLPEMILLDTREQNLVQGISPTVFPLIEEQLAVGNQVLFFINRRGYAPILRCQRCFWAATCTDCDAKLTFHLFPPRLICHHCHQVKAIIERCPCCQGETVHFVGVGTEQIEACMQVHFPKTSIFRVDRDSTQRKGSLARVLTAIHAQKEAILIGTQMLAKGHHFPHVTLVVILNADAGFFSADFRAIERIGQLILQVGGRAGRSNKPGKVYIQTAYPENPLLHCLLDQGYLEFAKKLLKERRDTQLPPYGFLALMHSDGKKPEQGLAFLATVKQWIESYLSEKIRILGPMPALMEKRQGLFRYQLLWHSVERQLLHHVLGLIMPQIPELAAKHRVSWILDVDPLDMSG